LKYLLDTWVSKLFGYDFTVEFKPGKQNAVADALSRRDEDKEDISMRAISMPELELFADLRRELSTLRDAIDKRQEIERGEAGAAWSLVDGFIVHNGRLFVPASSTLWPQILATAHGAGHEGVQKTLHRLRASFYNANANRLVREFILGCATCQRRRWTRATQAGSTILWTVSSPGTCRPCGVPASAPCPCQDPQCLPCGLPQVVHR